MKTIQIGDETIDLTLPFPREMYVADSKRAFANNAIRTVIAISNAGTKGKVVAISGIHKTFENQEDLVTWKYCKEIPPVKKLTVSQIEKELGYKIEVIAE